MQVAIVGGKGNSGHARAPSLSWGEGWGLVLLITYLLNYLANVKGDEMQKCSKTSIDDQVL